MPRRILVLVAVLSALACSTRAEARPFFSPVPPHAALLFDDGNGLFTGSRLTTQVILDEYGVKGNFFLIGRMMRDNPTTVRALVAAGHRVGNHTYSHPFLTTLTDAQIAQELDATEQQYRAIVPGGTTRPCFRAPNGAIDRRVASVVQARGYRQIDWTVGRQDWAKVSADAIVRNVLADLRDGALISFHTNEPATMVALRTLLPLMQSWGYVFDLVC
jgi:peptidoglycan/xylan/chitin deacetylase (PgdA/CDA1 family)